MAAPGAFEATVRSTWLPTGGAFKATVHAGPLLGAKGALALASAPLFEAWMLGCTEPCITALCYTLHRDAFEATACAYSKWLPKAAFATVRSKLLPTGAFEATVRST